MTTENDKKTETLKFGESSWDANDDMDGKVVNGKDLFLRLETGENEVRILTNPFIYLSHRFKFNETDPGFGHKIYCSISSSSCPICETGNKPKKRWLFGVISRKTGQYKIIDIGSGVYSSIKKLSQNKARFGDPKLYDISITKDPQAPPALYYSVQGLLPREPLSAGDQLIRDQNVNIDDLKRRTVPPTVQQVMERLTKLNNGITPTLVKVATGNSSGTVSEDDDEKMDMQFPEA